MTKFLPLLLAVCLVGLSQAQVSVGFYELSRLVQSGADESVILAYINSSPGTYRLTVDEIVQLRNMGATNAVITQALAHRAPPAPGSPPDSVQTKTVVVVQAVPVVKKVVVVDDDDGWSEPAGFILGLGLGVIFGDHDHHHVNWKWGHGRWFGHHRK